MRADSGSYLSLLSALAFVVSCGSGHSAGGNDPDLSGFTEPALVLSHPTLNSITSTPVGGTPYGVAISRENKAYVTLISDNTIVQTRLPALPFGQAITVGSVPAHVGFNPAGNRAYVTNQYGQSLSVIDVASNSEIASIPLGSDGFNLIVSKNGKKVYATTSAGTVRIINANTNTIVRSLQLGPVTNGLALNPSGSIVYISSRDAGTVTAINTTTDAIITTYLTGGAPQRMAVAPNGKELYIANETLGLDIWNLQTGARTTTISLPAYGLGMSPDGVHLYVTDPLGGTVAVVDRASRAVVTTLNVGGRPRNVAFNPAGKIALITNEGGFITLVR